MRHSVLVRHLRSSSLFNILPRRCLMHSSSFVFPSQISSLSRSLIAWNGNGVPFSSVRRSLTLSSLAFLLFGSFTSQDSELWSVAEPDEEKEEGKVIYLGLLGSLSVRRLDGFLTGWWRFSVALSLSAFAHSHSPSLAK